jgi:L-2-hydroxycarboxylate dehydrogenase (NAD+)
MHMDNWIERFRSAETVAGHSQVLIPGDPERDLEQERNRYGIPLLQPVVDDLKNLVERYGVSYPV